MTKQVKMSDFEAQWLALVDEVAATGETIVLIKDGQPVADLVPHPSAEKKSPFGIWKGKVEITGDIISPIDVEWNAMK